MHLQRIEQSLLPKEDLFIIGEKISQAFSPTTLQKTLHVAQNLFLFLALLLLTPLAIPYDWAQKKVTVENRASTEPVIWPPKQRGYACSFFQTAGLGTDYSPLSRLEGKCDWNQHIRTQVHLKEGEDPEGFFIDVLSDPETYASLLQAQGVSAHRFSLEWSVLEPKKNTFNPKAIQLYKKFVEALLKKGITPSATLQHFTVPAWFQAMGGFSEAKNIPFYLSYAKKMIEIFPDIKDFWSFNEPGVRAFQMMRGVYPLECSENASTAQKVHTAALSMRNMLAAHCLFDRIVRRDYPDQHLGITHQWLQFDMGSGNKLERITTYFLEKITHRAVYDFFKTGHFRLQIPFMTNVQMRIDPQLFKKEGHFLQRVGVQCYPRPLLKLGYNGFQHYPGTKDRVHNLACLTFGATAEKGEALMSLGCRHRAEAFTEVLDEAFALTDQVFITEYGVDSISWSRKQKYYRNRNNVQKRCLRDLTEVIQSYCQRKQKPLQGLFCWSDVRGQLEWDEGSAVQMGHFIPVIDTDRKLTSWDTTPVSKYMKEVFTSQSHPESLSPM